MKMKVSTVLAEVVLNRAFEVIQTSPGQSWTSGKEAASCNALKDAQEWVRKFRLKDAKWGGKRDYTIIHYDSRNGTQHPAGGCSMCR